MPSWKEVPEEIRRRFPKPPERHEFADDESFEEARGYWQGHVGRQVALAVMSRDLRQRENSQPTESVDDSSASPEELPSGLNPEELYQHLLRTHRNRKICCSACGDRYSFDNLNMCRMCGSVYCGRCTSKANAKQCDCGGAID